MNSHEEQLEKDFHKLGASYLATLRLNRIDGPYANIPPEIYEKSAERSRAKEILSKFCLRRSFYQIKFVEMHSQFQCKNVSCAGSSTECRAPGLAQNLFSE